MFRASDTQGGLFTTDKLYLNLVGEKTFYAYLAHQGHTLFTDDHFASWYCADNGRPCVSPSLLTRVLLLQMFDRCSDAEAVERAVFDIRWKVALQLDLEAKAVFAKSTLQQHRARFHLHPGAEKMLLKATIKAARKAGVLKGTKLRVALDTTPVFGRGAVKDTYNLVADGIRRLCRALAASVGELPMKWVVRHDLSRYFSASSLKGEAKIDWSSAKERQVFLQGLVADVKRLLLEADRTLGAMHDDKKAEAIKQAAELLRQLLAQDVDEDAGGKPTIKQEVCRDRVVSVTDPEMRHGRKSASKRFDGHKLAVAVDTQSQIITALDVIPGNAPDSTGALALVEATEEATDMDVERTLGDCAYGSGETRKEFDEAGRDLTAKVPAPPRDEPHHKAHFAIDLVGNSVTCWTTDPPRYPAAASCSPDLAWESSHIEAREARGQRPAGLDASTCGGPVWGRAGWACSSGA